MTTTFSNISSALNKVTLIALLSLTAMASLGSNTGLNAQAASTNLEFNYLQVTPKDGVNLRNGKCEKTKAINQGTILFQDLKLNVKNPNLTCTVGGKSYKMIPVNMMSTGNQFNPYDESYAAQEFLTIIGNESSNEYETVNSSNGLNLRDKNCKKVGSVSNNTKLKVGLRVDPIFCKVNGQTYHLLGLENGKYAASLFLK